MDLVETAVELVSTVVPTLTCLENALSREKSVLEAETVTTVEKMAI